jgi:hypothetical protein
VYVPADGSVIDTVALMLRAEDAGTAATVVAEPPLGVAVMVTLPVGARVPGLVSWTVAVNFVPTVAVAGAVNGSESEKGPTLTEYVAEVLAEAKWLSPP